jgi:hypothetical protein
LAHEQCGTAEGAERTHLPVKCRTDQVAVDAHVDDESRGGETVIAAMTPVVLPKGPALGPISSQTAAHRVSVSGHIASRRSRWWMNCC